MRIYAAGRASAASTSVRGPSVMAVANQPINLLECGVFNTTTSAFAVALKRVTTAGTQTGGLTEVPEDTDYVVNATAATGMSADSTTTGDPYVQASIGAAIGAGVIWTFGKNGLRVPAGTANGFVLTLPTGTGQIFDFHFVWEE